MKRRGNEDKLIVTNMTLAHTRSSSQKNIEVPVIVIRALKAANSNADAEIISLIHSLLTAKKLRPTYYSNLGLTFFF